jgi:hypothetical protein
MIVLPDDVNLDFGFALPSCEGAKTNGGLWQCGDVGVKELRELSSVNLGVKKRWLHQWQARS